MLTQLSTAKRVAGYGNVKRAKVSAIAFTSNGQIIANAHNRRVGGIPGKWTEHAEEVLIHKLNRIRAWNRYSDITILVLRINTKGLVMAKPCKKCQQILKQYPVEVFYTNRVGEIVRWHCNS